MRSGKISLDPIWKAFDEAAFGQKNTLNLRESLPTVADARFRVEAWLRERQVGGAREVLVITGRGNQSPGGVSPVREGIVALLPSLRRRGVVSDWKEHTSGSFVVRLAPISSLLNAPRRKPSLSRRWRARHSRCFGSSRFAHSNLSEFAIQRTSSKRKCCRSSIRSRAASLPGLKVRPGFAKQLRPRSSSSTTRISVSHSSNTEIPTE